MDGDLIETEICGADSKEFYEILIREALASGLGGDELRNYITKLEGCLEDKTLVCCAQDSRPLEVTNYNFPEISARTMTPLEFLCFKEDRFNLHVNDFPVLFATGYMFQPQEIDGQIYAVFLKLNPRD
ncbi:MAG: hypothetical protein ACOCXG_00730 [Nanoarchaeota archaeon]